MYASTSLFASFSFIVLLTKMLVWFFFCDDQIHARVAGTASLRARGLLPVPVIYFGGKGIVYGYAVGLCMRLYIFLCFFFFFLLYNCFLSYS